MCRVSSKFHPDSISSRLPSCSRQKPICHQRTQPPLPLLPLKMNNNKFIQQHQYLRHQSCHHSMRIWQKMNMKIISWNWSMKSFAIFFDALLDDLLIELFVDGHANMIRIWPIVWLLRSKNHHCWFHNEKIFFCSNFSPRSYIVHSRLYFSPCASDTLMNNASNVKMEDKHERVSLYVMMTTTTKKKKRKKKKATCIEKWSPSFFRLHNVYLAIHCQRLCSNQLMLLLQQQQQQQQQQVCSPSVRRLKKSSPEQLIINCHLDNYSSEEKFQPTWWLWTIILCSFSLNSIL